VAAAAAAAAAAVATTHRGSASSRGVCIRSRFWHESKKNWSSAECAVLPATRHFCAATVHSTYSRARSRIPVPADMHVFAGSAVEQHGQLAGIYAGGRPFRCCAVLQCSEE
jgi:hypothetical protein